ncbi:hypothetical protein [Micromonospora zhanjiangensis]
MVSSGRLSPDVDGRPSASDRTGPGLDTTTLREVSPGRDARCCSTGTPCCWSPWGTARTRWTSRRTSVDPAP